MWNILKKIETEDEDFTMYLGTANEHFSKYNIHMKRFNFGTSVVVLNLGTVLVIL